MYSCRRIYFPYSRTFPYTYTRICLYCILICICADLYNCTTFCASYSKIIAFQCSSIGYIWTRKFESISSTRCIDQSFFWLKSKLRNAWFHDIDSLCWFCFRNRRSNGNFCCRRDSRIQDSKCIHRSLIWQSIIHIYKTLHALTLTTRTSNCSLYKLWLQLESYSSQLFDALIYISTQTGIYFFDTSNSHITDMFVKI